MIKLPIKIVSKYKSEILILATINNTCNLECFYCYNKKPRSLTKLDLTQLYLFINEVYHQTQKHIKVHLLGGEPSLHPQLEQFCNILKNKAYVTIIIYTNFYNPIEFFKKINYNNVYFNITYHYNQNISDFMLKIQLFLSYDANIDLTFMYEHSLYLQIIDAYNLLIDNTLLKSVQIQLIMNNLKSKELFEYTNELLSMYYNTIKNCTSDNICTVLYDDSTSSDLTYYDLQFKPKILTLLWKCYAGIEYIEIDINGNVYSCISNSNNKLFNIYDSINMLKMPKKPIICKNRFCTISCWPITKEKMIK